ncbi:MAG TPA: ABC transporter permease [Candidatus Polarisedimenticolia bacterium]|nr:ABC transporter permease [Candidatus Polarisedimenticolia bacterium]
MMLPTRASRIGLAIVILFVLVAVFAPGLSRLMGQNPYDPVVPLGTIPPTAPGGSHLLGTDSLGRDILSRILYGSRVSLCVGILAEAVALLLGMSIGGLAGFYGGKVDEILMRLADIFFSMPAPLLALAVTAALPDPTTLRWLRGLPEPSLVVVLLVLGLIGWAGIARLVRAQVLVLREMDFTSAAKALGASGPRLLLSHLLPNALGPILATATLGVAGNILAEAWLSFLGVGAHPPLPSWGIMITEGQNYLTTHPWVCIYPGLALLLAVLGLNLFGDGLREGLDPRLSAARR